MEELASVIQNKFSIYSKVKFGDLPIELVEKIVKDTDLPGRLVFRKVSKYFRALVDKQTPRYKSIGIVINSKYIELDLERFLINYTNVKYDNCTVGIPGKKPKKMNRDNMDVMFDDLMTFMANPSFYVENLRLTFTDDASYQKFRTLYPERLPSSKIEVYSLFLNRNEHGTFKTATNFIDRSKLQKIERHWLKEVNSFWWRQYKELLVLDGDNFVGEQSCVSVPKDNLPWMKKYGKKKKVYEESRQRGNVVKWDVHWPKRLFI
ncbi:unnamed protein product [Caenorhabditis brenneri]